MYKATPSSLLPVKDKFISDSGIALLPKPDDQPLVSLFDDKHRILFKTIAVSTSVPGEWGAVLSIPNITIVDLVLYPILWRFVSDIGNTLYIKDQVLISPSEKRDSESVILNTDIEFTTKLNFSAETDLVVTIYDGNTVVTRMDFSQVTVKDLPPYSSSVTIPIVDLELLPSLAPYLIIFESSTNRYSHRLFIITPSIVKSSMDLEDYINKARISNVIPELAYASSDLIHYLDRGLALFNSFPPQVTGFTGLNMQGSVLDCWLICSTYYILTAQLQAENAFSFDFSGQSISLNVDRTQGIEGAIGRMESMMDNVVKPFKKLLIKSGVSGGDGNIQGALSFGRAFGKTVLTNNPVSRTFSGMRGSTLLNAYPFRRGQF